MATKRRGLGRNLDALLGGRTAPVAPAEPGAEAAHGPDTGLRTLPIDLIRPGRYQPRQEMDPARLQELADSLRAQGMVQPIVVRPLGDDRYEIVAGERRWRAAQLAGLAEVPAVVREVDDRATLAMALIENIQREDLHPLEEARALARLIEEFGLTHQQAAEAVGRSRAAVSNLLRLLDLEAEVKAYLERGELEMGHARALLGLAGPAQCAAAREVVRRGLSVRETEKLVRRLQQQAARPPAPARVHRVDPDVARLEQRLAEHLGAPVQVRMKGRGKGELVIRYSSLEELDGLLERMQVRE
ncbi:MAG: ParB/RepB/Spo0J family partition protein [Gammaproteobacteria bacterium]|nr:MAG: ParB/RepB/Spo0J family partition protein [Gammaproteobacteria bacterium]